jgi:methyltransferase (TIGR00027 family)
MKKQQSSLTAEGIALVRAMESEKPADERICYDPYARYFVSPALALVAQLFFKIGYARRRGPGVQEFLIARARYIDDYLQACIDDGIEQLVILGAGFDSRAYRFEALKGQAKVFEVDHPATQQVKIERLKKILGALPTHVVFVPIDFESESLEKRLPECGYEKQRKTLFIWEGVVCYLPAEAVDRTLAFVANNSGAGSSIIFDYIYAAVIRGTLKRGETAAMRRNRWLTGEALVFGIEEGQIEEFLQRRGFAHIQNATSADLKVYFTGVNRGREVAPVYAIASATVKPRGVE